MVVSIPKAEARKVDFEANVLNMGYLLRLHLKKREKKKKTNKQED